jgi:hypothetical protein
MAVYKVAGNMVIRHDASAGGTLEVKTSYIDTVEPISKEVEALDVTHFDDVGERIVGGIELASEFTTRGAFDDTATVGPDAIYSTAVGTNLSWEFNPVGTASGKRKTTFEAYLMSYSVSGSVKGRVEYEARWKKDGTITHGAN